jgi:hypothetical protein
MKELSPMLLEMRQQGKTYRARYDNPGFNDAVERFLNR